jgi:acyl-CoA-binding protein
MADFRICPLGYPDRYESAALFVRQNRNGGKDFPLDIQLVLYALYQQASIGPNMNNKPGGWGWGDAEEIGKWEAWKALGTMNRMEAMRLYVRAVERLQVSYACRVKVMFFLELISFPLPQCRRTGTKSLCKRQITQAKQQIPLKTIH